MGQHLNMYLGAGLKIDRVNFNKINDTHDNTINDGMTGTMTSVLANLMMAPLQFWAQLLFRSDSLEHHFEMQNKGNLSYY